MEFPSLNNLVFKKVNDAKILQEINRTRISFGMRPIEPKKRRCLKCDREFVSISPSNRMCGCLKEGQYGE